VASEVLYLSLIISLSSPHAPLVCQNMTLLQQTIGDYPLDPVAYCCKMASVWVPLVDRSFSLLLSFVLNSSRPLCILNLDPQSVCGALYPFQEQNKRKVSEIVFSVG
jgi:hypothetical protein